MAVKASQVRGLWRGVVDSVGCEKRKLQRASDVDGDAVAGFFFPLEMALEFDIDILRAENADQVGELSAGLVRATLGQGSGKRAFVAAGQQDQAWGMFFEFLCCDRAFAFFGAQLHFCDQATQVLVPGTGGDEERETEFTTGAFVSPW